MIDSSLHEKIYLKDGRTLGYARFGDPKAFPVLFFHGIPGSRLQRPLELDYLSQLDLCLYCIERPGIGLSTAKDDRTILEWAEDISQFCAKKGFDQVAVVGISGGSPYAFGLAHRYPDLVKSLTIISGMPPLSENQNFRVLPLRTRLIFSLVLKMPRLSGQLTGLALSILNNRIDLLFTSLLTMLPESDKKLLKEPAAMNLFKEDVNQAFISGTPSVIKEVLLLLQPWGFDLEDINHSVHIWHGLKDTILPPGLANALIERLKSTNLTLLPDEGHFFALKASKSIFESIWQDIKHN